jgi:3-oxoacyl-[acyl-carrier protein] reductase
MSDLFDVSQEIILVTGASQGLGRQFARVLAAHGAAVVLAARQTGKLKALEEEINAVHLRNSSSNDLFPIACDGR